MTTANTPTHSEIEPSPSTEPLWRVEDVAAYLRLNPETVRNMARRGELPSIKVGRRIWRFKSSAVKEWLNARASAEGIA